MLNSPSNLSFKFGAKFVEIDKKFILTRNAIDELTDRVNAIPAVNIDELNSKITANTEDITEISAKVNSNETDIDSLETDLGELTSRVDSNKTNITTMNTELEELTPKVTANASNITTINDNLGTLTSKVNSNETDIGSLGTDLNALTDRVAANEDDIEKYGGWINNLVSSVAYNKENPFNDFYKHLFDMIYPKGSIYTTVIDTPPPNVYDLSGTPYATWALLETGTFLRNIQDNKVLGDRGGTAVTELPAHTHTTNVQIRGELYSGSGASVDSDSLVNCTLFAPNKTTDIPEYENVFYNTGVDTKGSVSINWTKDSTISGNKGNTRTTSSIASMTTYFPIALNVNKNYTTNSESTVASNTNVEVIADNELPDNCPPFMYVKMYKRTA